MNNKNNNVVYLHYKKNTNEVFYVGLGSPGRPWCNKRSEEWKSIDKDFGHDTIVVCDNLPLSEASAIEKALISSYGRKDLGLGELVNKTNGGLGTSGAIVSKETREKRGASLRGRVFTQEHRDNIGNASRGRVHTEESKKKISIASKGKKHTEESITKMVKAQANRTDDGAKRAQRTRRLQKMDDKTYLQLIEDIKNKLEGKSSLTEKQLWTKYGVTRRFIRTHTNNVKNNNIII
tara:strand:- start:3412 stop:4116 length:705 start_codon:yes stop_codon:yes gene_type:complete